MRLSKHTSLIRDVDGLYLVSEHDVPRLAEANHDLAVQKPQLTGSQKHWLHIARMPNNLFDELVRRFGKPKHNPAAWKRWLNDPDNQVFRTWHGRV